MRPLCRAGLFLALAGCAAKEGDGLVTWAGYVLDGPYVEGTELLSGASVTFEDLSGELVDEARESDPSKDPGFFEAELTRDTDLAIRVVREGVYPTLWRAPSPSRDAYWVPGALFAYDEAKWHGFFAQFAPLVRGLGELGPDVCWMFGYPDDPDAWIDADIAVIDGTGQAVQVRAYTVTATGEAAIAESDPIHEFFSFELAAGDIYLSVAFPGGETFQVLYPGCSGEIINAWFLAVPRSDP